MTSSIWYVLKVPNNPLPPIKRYFSMKFCLLVTVALGIFLKEKIILYIFLGFLLSFFYSKGIYSVNLNRGTPLTIFQPLPHIPATPLIIFYTNFQPPCLLDRPPRLFGTLEYANFSEKLLFLAYVYVTGGQEMLVSWNILRMY